MTKSIEPYVISWFAEEMKKGNTTVKQQQDYINSEIEEALKKSPSKAGGKGPNRPDFHMLIELKDMKRIPVMIEAKGAKGKLCKKDKDGNISVKAGDINGYAVNGALHYANAILKHTQSYSEVLAVGINGSEVSGETKYEAEIWYVSKDNLHVPKLIGTSISILQKKHWNGELIENIKKAKLTEAEQEAAMKDTENAISDLFKELNQKMHDEWQIDNKNRIELIAGMVMAGLGVAGKVSPLDVSELKGLNGKSTHDGQQFIRRINDFLVEKQLPDEKKDMIINALQRVFINLNLQYAENGESKLKSIYRFVHDELLPYLNQGEKLRIDFTGRFFNVLTDWAGVNDDAANDCVLTPRYVTDLMAKLCRVNKESYVWDYTTGTAGFLVSSMNIMLKDADTIEDANEREQKKCDIRSKQLLGVELRPDMYLLGVLNMILMGDGTSNIIQANSLDEKQFKGNYEQGDLKDKPFGPEDGGGADVFLLNPPYSAPGKGFIFVEKALSRMNHGRAAVLIQENAGSGNGLPFTKNILQKNKLIASIHMADIFKGKAGVQTAIYLFDVGKAHAIDDEVVFIDMTNDGYTRQNRKKASASTNLKDTDNAAERYAEVADIILGKRKKTDHFKDGETVFRDVISLEGNDWTLKQHKKYDTRPTEDDFKKTVAEYLAWKVGAILRGEVQVDG